MAKKNIKKLKQVDGKAEPKNTEKEFQPTTLDQLWGYAGKGKYNTNDEAAYTQGLNDMNKSDLQHHAVQIGLIPVDNRQILVQRLVREFRKHYASFGLEKKAPQPKKKISEETIRILSGGR